MFPFPSPSENLRLPHPPPLDRSSPLFCTQFYSFFTGLGLPVNFFLLYFLCYIIPCGIFFVVVFHVGLKELHSLQQILLIYVRHLFFNTLKRKYYWSWATRTDSLPCDLPVFISKLSQSKKVELSATFLSAFDNFFISINDTVQLYFQLHFIFIVTTS